MNTPRRARSKHQPNPNTLTFDITGMVYGGYGVSQHQGKPLYLPYTIEGERVEARLLPLQKNAQFAEGIKLLRASLTVSTPSAAILGRAGAAIGSTSPTPRSCSSSTTL